MCSASRCPPAVAGAPSRSSSSGGSRYPPSRRGDGSRICLGSAIASGRPRARQDGRRLPGAGRPPSSSSIGVRPGRRGPALAAGLRRHPRPSGAGLPRERPSDAADRTAMSGVPVNTSRPSTTRPTQTIAAPIRGQHLRQRPADHGADHAAGPATAVVARRRAGVPRAPATASPRTPTTSSDQTRRASGRGPPAASPAAAGRPRTAASDREGAAGDAERAPGRATRTPSPERARRRRTTAPRTASRPATIRPIPSTSAARGERCRATRPPRRPVAPGPCRRCLRAGPPASPARFVPCRTPRPGTAALRGNLGSGDIRPP